jgi:ribosomal protein S27AE
MSIISCPRCGGSGAIYDGSPETTVGIQKQICPSCGGKGYVTDSHIKEYPLTDGTSEVKTNWFNPIVTRDPDRIDVILASIRAIWRRFPDWRLGQLLANAVPDYERNMFYIEDTIAEEKLNAFEVKIEESLTKHLEKMQ